MSGVTRKLNIRVYKINNLTVVKVNKAVSRDGPWGLSKELASYTGSHKIEYGKMRKFKKK